MKLDKREDREHAIAANRSAIHGAQRRTLESIFQHPAASNLEWMDVVELVGKIGSMHEKGGDEYDIHVGGKYYLMHKPHTKDLTGSEVVDLRHFLRQAGWSPEAPSEAVAHPDLAPPTLIVVVNHYGAKIYRVHSTSGDATAKEIHPYDPHRLLHHLMRKKKSDEKGKHETEQMAFYERVAGALAAGGKLIVLAHGEAKSNEAQGLTEYLREHHGETYQRVVSQATTDLSSITQPKLLALAEQALAVAT